MKKLLIPFLVTIVVTIPFFSNPLVADSQAAYSVFDLQEEEYTWNVRFNEIKAAKRGSLSEKDFIKLVHFLIPESDQVIVVDLREECNGMPTYWADGFHGHFNQTTEELEQDENECLREVLDVFHGCTEEGEYQINQLNLAILQAITEREFVESYEHRYVRFPITDGNLQNDLFVDQLLQHTHDFSTDYRIHLHYLPEKTTILLVLLDIIKNSQQTILEDINDYVSQGVSDFNTPWAECVSQRSAFTTSQQVLSNSIYDRLLCGYEVRGEVNYQWGGKDGGKCGGSVKGTANDGKGNSVSGTIYHNSDGTGGVSVGGGHAGN